VCHSGVGSIISSLEYNKPVIVVPRLKLYGEVIDDHQTEIAKELEERGLIKVVYDLERLGDVLKGVDGEFKNFNKKNELASNLEKYLKNKNMRKK
jgi:beta-1,4-N-acetylglucosaminyltransferase